MTDSFRVIGLLYESDEWSDYKLKDELEGRGFEVRMLDLEHEDISAALECDVLVSRVFASAQFRNHLRSLELMPDLIAQAEKRGIPLINPGRAHAFEVDKYLATQTLAGHGISVPELLGRGTPSQIAEHTGSFTYPCVIKPSCSGRTRHTAIVRDSAEATDFLAQLPETEFIVQEYIEPAFGYLTRIEIVEKEAALVVTRSVATNGLSSYTKARRIRCIPPVHLGSSRCPRRLHASSISGSGVSTSSNLRAGRR